MPNFQKEPAIPPPVPTTTDNQAKELNKTPEKATSEVPEEKPPVGNSFGPKTNVKCQNSSLVDSFEYDKRGQILRVYFKGGQVYDYFFVPEEVAENFRKVCEDPMESAGKWFARAVRKTYEYQRVV